MRLSFKLIISMKENMNRGEFLKSLGLSSSALMAFYCLGTATSCSSTENPAPLGNTNPTGTTNTSNKIDFTLDLSTADYKTLKTEGEFVYKDKIIVANTKGGNYVALSKACTHASADIKYRLTENDFWCSLHGSEFNTSGSVKKSPATSALNVYKTELKGDKLRIYES
jgi:cytochrome b6-f complex iron-sulfur subunit